MNLFKSTKNNFETLITNADLYETRVNNLIEKKTRSKSKIVESKDFKSIQIHSKDFAKNFAQSVKNKEHVFGRATTTKIETDGKVRIVYEFSLLDTILGGVIADAINTILESHLSSKLHSYRHGFKWYKPIKEIADIFRDNFDEAGFYLLKRDIASYTDTIPVHECSPLWGELQQILYPKKSLVQLRGHYPWQLLKKLIRPTIMEKGHDYTNYIGIPTGQPITATLYNLYATQLDDCLGVTEGAYYSRYSDDFIFFHKDHLVCEKTSSQIDEILQIKGLSVKESKMENLYISTAGHKPTCSDPQINWSGTHFVNFLGCQINANGTIALTSKKKKRLLQEIKKITHSILKKEGNTQSSLKKIVHSINLELSPDSIHGDPKSANLLRKIVTDRGQLKDIDYLIGRIIIDSFFRTKSVKNLRKISIQDLRDNYGLISLVNERNENE